jgi:hypothetical protein
MFKRTLEPVSEQPTVPLPSVPSAVLALTFAGYLQRYELSVLDVARAAGVPAITVWSVEHGRAVAPVQARRVRQALLRLTGVPYMAAINTTK